MPTPVAWVQENEQNLVFSARHESGGHFAAMEKPELLWGDVEAFVQKAWKGGEGDDDKEGKGAKI
jgi:microsomal epoxide hydrolase